MLRTLLVSMLLSTMVGCTSFRTTALYRFSNDSVAPEGTRQKLKGLPVKLKVPSHMLVKIYEQQVILADSPDAQSAKSKAVAEIQSRIATQQELIKGLSGGVQAATDVLDTLTKEKMAIQGRFDSELDSEKKKALQKVLTKYVEAIVAAETALGQAREKLLTLPEENEKLRRLEEKKVVSERDASIQYTLISFDPAQYIVETDLQYTDKVFLVDFKRPAGGILNVTSAKMDDEQYFANVQAEVNERTLGDINTALGSLTDPLVNTIKTKSKHVNVAQATSSQTSLDEANKTVNFQHSVVAIQRFDISEIGWEERLQEFVNQHIAVASGQVGGEQVATSVVMPGIPAIAEFGPPTSIGSEVGSEVGNYDGAGNNP